MTITERMWEWPGWARVIKQERKKGLCLCQAQVYYFGLGKDQVLFQNNQSTFHTFVSFWWVHPPTNLFPTSSRVVSLIQSDPFSRLDWQASKVAILAPIAQVLTAPPHSLGEWTGQIEKLVLPLHTREGVVLIPLVGKCCYSLECVGP